MLPRANLRGSRTAAASLCRGTDGVRIETLDEGRVWVFAAIDHFDDGCVGIHAVRTGTRFAALQRIAQGPRTEFGATGARVGRGLTRRMDHRTQYTADDFLNQVRFWGIAPSFAFVAEPTRTLRSPRGHHLAETG